MAVINFEELIGKIKDINFEGNAASDIIKKYQDAMQNRYGKSSDPLPLLSAPTYTDLWYLYNHVNMLTYVEVGDTEAFFTNRLSFFKDKLGGMRPMRGLTPVGEITYVWLTEEVPDIQSWLQKAKPWIQLLAFEIVFKNQKFRYGTDLALPKDVDIVGYIMIPVGQPGVMEIISLVRETDTEVDGFSIQDDEKPIPSSGEMFPPHDKWEIGKCYGRHLIEKMYEIPDVEKEKVFFEHRDRTVKTTEYIDERHPDYMKLTSTEMKIPIEEVYGKGKDKDGKDVPSISGHSVKPKGWMRVWITAKEKWPIPGEFIGIICKPNLAPPHFWWQQESFPFVYAGNWFDTWDLSSGVIKEVTADQEHPDTGVSCTKYKVRYHGEDCYVYSSDFLEYTVGDRVGIVKLGTHLTEGAFIDDSFTMVEQQWIGDMSPVDGVMQETTDLVIIPITYYKED